MSLQRSHLFMSIVYCSNVQKMLQMYTSIYLIKKNAKPIFPANLPHIWSYLVDCIRKETKDHIHIGRSSKQLLERIFKLNDADTLKYLWNWKLRWIQQMPHSRGCVPNKERVKRVKICFKDCSQQKWAYCISPTRWRLSWRLAKKMAERWAGRGNRGLRMEFGLVSVIPSGGR